MRATVTVKAETTVAGDGGGARVWSEDRAFAAASPFGEVRWGKIEALRRQIAAGTYFVPAEALAEAMIRAGRVQ